ncbi:hypothetical protein BDW75DRAFT_19130 [Aspergillus navahoensis]
MFLLRVAMRLVSRSRVRSSLSLPTHESRPTAHQALRTGFQSELDIYMTQSHSLFLRLFTEKPADIGLQMYMSAATSVPCLPCACAARLLAGLSVPQLLMRCTYSRASTCTGRQNCNLADLLSLVLLIMVVSKQVEEATMFSSSSVPIVSGSDSGSSFCLCPGWDSDFCPAQSRGTLRGWISRA